ncbi:Uncharacterized conserved protein [Methylobacillus rhizosphaerae]|uniref:Uncharacterized conserved protein n=1 Tax=Methylobacillus rhizosphaerae TaxID=551994 RepID=A0A238ZCN5_9PROT|nr:DUF411 domain-containing protein [Methylobacillus rhizosphaerae]SNR80842.1 Uncharacterized conserved protein [Methylobacillus rhizosphaerae]
MYVLTRFTALLLLLASSSVWALPLVTLYKDANCGCCQKYVAYLREHGFKVEAFDRADMGRIKQQYGVTRVASCHTALIGGYVVEGHVPVTAIQKLLQQKPAIAGISVPDMPTNSPGMGEMKPGTLTVYTIPAAGEMPRVFSVE